MEIRIPHKVGKGKLFPRGAKLHGVIDYPGLGCPLVKGNDGVRRRQDELDGKKKGDDPEPVLHTHPVNRATGGGLHRLENTLLITGLSADREGIISAEKLFFPDIQDRFGHIGPFW